MPYPETTIVRHLRSRLVYVFIFPQVSFANAHSTSRLSVVLPLQGKLICIFNDRFGLKSHAPSNVYDANLGGIMYDEYRDERAVRPCIGQCSSHKSCVIFSSSSRENVRVLETRFSGDVSMNCPAMSIV